MRWEIVNNKILACILLSLAILASGQAAAQGTYGTKVQTGDQDVGLPLCNFAGIGFGQGGQAGAWISYWDLNANGIYDSQDVPYLQFGSFNAPGLRFVHANNIRLSDWGNYPAGSYVTPTDTDMGMPLNVIPFPFPPLTAAPQVSFYYMDVSATAGYDLGDPVYLKVLSPPLAVVTAGTNDIRITANAGFPAGSKVSLNDPDAGRALTPFKTVPGGAVNGNGGPFAAATVAPIASLMFYNANGNVIAPGGQPIFDDGDVVYFHVGGGLLVPRAVAPNDIRLY